MKKLFLALLLLFIPYLSWATTDEPWVVFPPGGKPAYMGIHGGTMPVSLLVSDDGASLLTFVGRTGNDFLEVLRRSQKQGQYQGSTDQAWKEAIPFVFAGNATTSMPVIALSGDLLSRLGHQLQPFGLSPERLSIEGEVTRPEFSPVRKPRSFSLYGWLFPNKTRK